MNIASINILELGDNAQTIYSIASTVALELLFEGCETIEQINRKADELIELIF